jgi:4-carboxymuconolactone decarboxylase
MTSPHVVDGAARRQRGAALFHEVMTVPSTAASSPYNQAGLLDFVFAEVWARPGLTRRDRRWITLACVGAADTVGPIEAHVYAALRSGDMTFVQMQEFVLHFAVYCGWPKASFLDEVVWRQQSRIAAERGEPGPDGRDWPIWQAGMEPEARLSNGEQCFADVNCVPFPGRTTAYRTAGILNFVFGEVWQRPGLSIRDRRFITLACVGLDDAVGPIKSHFYSALKSGDITIEEMRELILQFAAYSGVAKAQFLDEVVTEAWVGIERGADRSAR